jgi:hypothetical protein
MVRRLTQLGEPHCATATSWVFHNGSYNLKALAIEQVLIFGGIETGMIKRLPFKPPYGFTMSRAACEHQSGAWFGVSSKYGKHLLLIMMVQVEKAVPGENTVKGARER